MSKNRHEVKRVRHLVNKNFCSGCMACRNICPQKAIEIFYDEKGFKYPYIIEEKCIDCGLCDKTCPALNIAQYLHPIKCLAFKHKDNTVRNASSSGGFFTWISDQILAHNGVVYGVVLGKGNKAIHIRSESSILRNRMRGSKYVESDIGFIYQDVKKDLVKGRKVLFTGTPCQCEALQCYLAKPYENLYTLDFACKGAPSQKVIDDFICFAENKLKKKIIDINFRDKDIYKYESPPILGRRLIFFTDDGQITYNRKINQRFHDCFFVGAFQREYCLNCKFHSFERCTDFTCGDFHRFHLDPSFSDEYGLSLLLVNSKKANALLTRDIDNVEILECREDECIQPVLVRSMNKKWRFYDIFWKIYMKHGFEQATRLILPRIYRVKIERYVKGKLTGLYDKMGNR